ncbi:MAG: D-alanyl-D-alanine carboxypeptidase [Lentisphaeria bacterium]|nr:serine hydrolase [Lentisphaeria bacterium]NQZ69441.1 D-alanyl-D-alanine carboxypeptidase [Lentisphaeria bacterium]
MIKKPRTKTLILNAMILIVTVLIAASSYWIYKTRDLGPKPEISDLPDEKAPALLVIDQQNNLDAKLKNDLQKKTELKLARTKKSVYDYQQLNLEMPKSMRGLASQCRSGIVINESKQTILWAKKPDKAVPIASMTKLMTILVAMEIINADETLSLDSMVRVSRAAERVPPTEVWLAAGHDYRIGDLMRASMIRSANDACYATAEGLAPGRDMSKFIIIMNRRARELGLRYSRFYNVHGLPGRSASQDNRASVMDIAIIAQEVMKHAKIMEWTGSRTGKFVHYNGKVVDLVSSNKLLNKVEGITGLKTGYIRRSGFCIAVSADRDGEKRIAIITGFKSKYRRNDFAKELINWAYTNE